MHNYADHPPEGYDTNTAQARMAKSSKGRRAKQARVIAAKRDRKGSGGKLEVQAPREGASGRIPRHITGALIGRAQIGGFQFGQPPDAINVGAVPSAGTAPVAASSMSAVSARADLTLTPQPVTVVPTPYPDDPEAPLVVHGFIQIDPQSDRARELSAKLDDIVRLLKESNLIVGEIRDQLVGEIQAGRTLLTTPKPNRALVEVLLIRPLTWIAAAAVGGIIADYAVQALHILQDMMHAGIPI